MYNREFRIQVIEYTIYNTEFIICKTGLKNK